MLKSRHEAEEFLTYRCFARERSEWREIEKDLRQRLESASQRAARLTEDAPTLTGANMVVIALGDIDHLRGKLEQEQIRLREWASKALGVVIDGPPELAVEKIAEVVHRNEQKVVADILDDLRHHAKTNKCFAAVLGHAEEYWGEDDY